MKNHIVLKFIAIILCACSLLVTVASAAGCIFLAQAGLYEQSVEDMKSQSLEYSIYSLARHAANRYAALTLGNCPERFLDSYHVTAQSDGNWQEGRWFYTIRSEDGTLLTTNYTGTPGATDHTLTVSSYYPSIISYEPVSSAESGGYQETTYRDETFAPTDSMQYSADASPYVDHVYWYDEETGTEYSGYLTLEDGPVYLVTVHLLPDAYDFGDQPEWALLEFLWNLRYILFAILAGGLLLFAIFAVYLCCAAGRNTENKKVRPGGLNRLPLDLYAFAVFCGVMLLGAAGIILIENLWPNAFVALAICCGILGFFMCLLAVAFGFALAAQVKAGHGFWWRKSVTGILLMLALTLLKKLWELLVLCVKTVAGAVSRLVSLLPIMWRRLLLAAALGLLALFAVASGAETLLFLSLVLIAAVVIYQAYAFAVLQKSSRRMSRGDLNTKVDDTLLLGSNKEFAENLNALADAAMVAAKKQMRSERMKAELVTNVSHDIKTPLTSIINYIDLLQKAKSPEEAEQYLEVLSRQSQRMKKLIEDLVEMSKATTGNIALEITQVDAAEAVNQALGEFADKLASCHLTPIFHPPAEPVVMLADGRLAWRVLSNLLSNAVKYALPGTRLYIDLVKLEGKVMISLKNISREQLNVSSDELMERFVRGDASRNTEGSGLGLNIAKSLMELQNGQLQLLVDGDLFKATAIFPGV